MFKEEETMHFMFYMIFAPLLVALAAGAFLFVWSGKNNSGFGKFMGSLITLVALVLIALQTWSMSTNWQHRGIWKKDMEKMMKQIPDASK